MDKLAYSGVCNTPLQGSFADIHQLFLFRSEKDQKIAQSTHENEHIKPRKTFWRNSKQLLILRFPSAIHLRLLSIVCLLLSQSFRERSAHRCRGQAGCFPDNFRRGGDSLPPECRIRGSGLVSLPSLRWSWFRERAHLPVCPVRDACIPTGCRVHSSSSLHIAP